MRRQNKIGVKPAFLRFYARPRYYSQMSDNEPQNLDPKFYDRADAHINLSNDQSKQINPGKVSASMMYATARFNAYVSWIGFDHANDIAKAREETVKYFVEQYQIMLEEILDDYIRNFDQYKSIS